MTTCRGRIHSTKMVPVLLYLMCFATARAHGQGLGGAGTVQGTVTDSTGAVMLGVPVALSNPVAGLARTTATDTTGKFVFSNLPLNPYHLSIDVQGFQRMEQDIDVRSAVPLTVNVALSLAEARVSVDVVGHAGALVERDPTAHTDIDQSLIARLPIESVAGLNQIVTLASPGVVADSNGFFHPIGDHAQTQFSIDNQPVADQQSRLYSNQLSPDAVESMEIITGVAPAEYGDKSSLIVQVVTKSGLDRKPFGEVSFGYGSFSSPMGGLSLGWGSRTFGNFLSVSGMRTDRFLDPPELQPLHDAGRTFSLFDRLDARIGGTGTFHLNLQGGRSTFDVPNSLDAAVVGQAQRQEITSLNIAPGFSQALGTKTLFTANAFFRKDRLTYTPSPDRFADQPGSVGQDRSLANVGVKADLQYSAGSHNVKLGGVVSATLLHENLAIGFTDPAFNSPCLETDGTPAGNPALRSLAHCVGSLTPNPDFNASLLPFDLTRGGTSFAYNQTATIKQQASYVQDDITAGPLTMKVGLRLDHYDGLSSATALQPRIGASYAVSGIDTVLRASYGRTLETPYNENLLLSTGVGAAALTGTASPPPPGRRNQVEVGVQQRVGRWVVADVGYFNKRTDNGYDFNVLFNTPIAFPVAWDHSQIDGVSARVNFVDVGGFKASVVMAHTNAIYFPPATGGVLLTPPCETPGCSFRIDHDQKFNATTYLQYLAHKPSGTWIGLNWRYDSGLVVSAIGDVNDLLTLTPAQQATAGVSCGGVAATPTAGFTTCPSGAMTSSRLVVPAAGTGDPLNNPARVAPRHLFDLGIGTDNLLSTDKVKVRLRLSVINLTNNDALYNFLSTFSGTHFVAPRTYQVQVGVGF